MASEKASEIQKMAERKLNERFQEQYTAEPLFGAPLATAYGRRNNLMIVQMCIDYLDRHGRLASFRH